jgi:diguanylate cyclase (GGDEF)-like protein
MNARIQNNQELRLPSENRVLVVDDDSSILGVITEVLEDDGYKVTTAGSGEEAIEALKNNKFALVMTDIRLPGINGVAVLEHVKEVRPRTNVIMITSHASLDTVIKALKHGAYDYLLKPFEDLSLISTAAKRAVDSFNLDLDRSQLIRSLESSNEELARVNQVLHGLAIRDGLTDLYNHRYINEVLDKQIERASIEDAELSLIFVDVDNFKKFNDEHGHQNGDVILRELSSLMRENVRERDIVARWGGEEFVVVCPNTDQGSAAILAESLRGLIAKHPFLKGVLQSPFEITISAGVSSLAALQSKPDLVDAADAALYAAKDNGRNQVQIAS